MIEIEDLLRTHLKVLLKKIEWLGGHEFKSHSHTKNPFENYSLNFF